MTRREKIMLATAGVAAVLALFLLPGGGQKPSAPMTGGPAGKDAAGRVRALESRVKAAIPNAIDTVILASVQEPWRRTAIYDKSLEGRQTAQRSDLRYTGYVELGSGRLAVVNGFEYQVGDALEGGGYTVVAITSDAVTLESLDNGKRRDLPYQGQETVAR